MTDGFWLGPDRMEVPEGELRLLSAWEVLEARREGEALSQDGGELAVCRNACLVAKALEREGAPVFSSGRAALDGLRLEDIARLAQAWAQFDREADPSPMDGGEEIAKRKKAWSTRIMSAFNGACSGRSALCPPRSGRKR